MHLNHVFIDAHQSQSDFLLNQILGHLVDIKIAEIMLLLKPDANLSISKANISSFGTNTRF